MVTPGGEVAFITKRLLPESLALREQVGWYTAMLGKHTSVFAVVDALRAAGIDNYAVTEFVQGSKTRRWAVGWSFGPMRPDEHVCRRMDEPSWRSVLPAPVRHDVFAAGAGSVGTERLVAGVNALGQALELAEWVWDEAESSGRGRARQNVWSRAWRRKKMRAEKDGEAGAADLETGLGGKDAACAIGFKLSVVVGFEEVKVICRWTEGHDHLLLESLLGFLRTRISSLMK
ncbi:unnamed protein product [Parascedosporium putredinis]|nr:unnamed protein product [Parascedosporium putredinis]CAI7991977.1 unnamed protein product [Parascedosporium putredinis]